MVNIIAAKAGEIAQGGRKIVEVSGREIVLFNLGNKYYAIENICPHQAGPVGEGEISEGDVVACPLHEWRFNIKTGQSPDFSGIAVKTFPVRVENGNVILAMD
ncbi:MAG: Rieske (2Fe-2S) protein [DPANN group archaeon]|nr:Rieske (2Fe-2S) protein [DPANN group archaeon]